MGHQGRILRYFCIISPSSLINTRVLYGCFFGSSCFSPVSEKTPQTFVFLHAAANISVTGPGMLTAVANISSRSYMMPCVLYSGNTIKSMPGKPCFMPSMMPQIFLTFSCTSSFVCNLGILYWYTHTPTVSGELLMSPCLDIV